MKSEALANRGAISLRLVRLTHDRPIGGRILDIADIAMHRRRDR